LSTCSQIAYMAVGLVMIGLAALLWRAELQPAIGTQPQAV
jgi:hypothetical protein